MRKYYDISASTVGRAIYREIEICETISKDNYSLGKYLLHTYYLPGFVLVVT
jgi:hypothetical protein